MNLCRSGKHDKDVVGQDAHGRCTGCRRITNRRANQARSKAKRVRPADKCQSGVHPKTGPGPCRPCAQAKAERKLAAARERRKTRPSTGRGHTEPVPVDGWESDLGPCPPRVPNRDWFDHVIVDRVLHGHTSGRAPYPLEWAEIFKRTDKTYHELSNLTGIGWEAVRLRYQRWVKTR